MRVDGTIGECCCDRAASRGHDWMAQATLERLREEVAYLRGVRDGMVAAAEAVESEVIDVEPISAG